MNILAILIINIYLLIQKDDMNILIDSSHKTERLHVICILFPFNSCPRQNIYLGMYLVREMRVLVRTNYVKYLSTNF